VSDTQRALAGIIVCAVLLFAYAKFVAPAITGKPGMPVAPAPEAPAPETPEKDTEPAPAESPPDTGEIAAPSAPPAPEEPAELADEPELRNDITCETELFRVELTNKGAAVRSVTLLDYKMFPEREDELTLLTDIAPGKYSLTMAQVDGLARLDEVNWEYVPECPVPDGYADVAQFRTRSRKLGLEIEKTFLFRNPDDKAGHPGRDMELKITMRSTNDQTVLLKYRLRSAAGIVPEPELPDPDLATPGTPVDRSSRDVAAVVGTLGGEKAELETYSASGAAKKPRYDRGDAIYAGVRNRYFAAVLAPLSDNAGITSVLLDKIGEHSVTADITIVSQEVTPEGTTNKFMFLVAPCDREILQQYGGRHFDAVLGAGFLGPVKYVLTWLLGVFHDLIPNYGVAIILLTICVRFALHPLTLKSQKSIHKVQKIQPLISAVKEKYKHDKRQQQQEVMKVMREQGASPLGGCLPMLLQLPIFIGLWRSLYENVSLRHAPFLLWMRDLSKPDNLVSFSSGIALIGQSLNLLPLLCAILMIVQQKMAPKPTDPQAQQQQKIMMIMPVVFAVMLYKMPSGLMLYFLCSSMFGVLEQRYIRNRLDLAAAASGPSSAVPVEQKRQKPAPQRRRKRLRK